MGDQLPPLFLAPMAGVTDLAYRILARECGADVTVTEFTAASGLTRRNTYSWLKVESDPRESPFIPQIFGGIIEEMVQTVEMLQDRADVIDINFGCPAPTRASSLLFFLRPVLPTELVGLRPTWAPQSLHGGTSTQCGEE